MVERSSIVCAREKYIFEFDEWGSAMNKWFYWLFLSLGFGVGGIVNYLDGKRSVASFIPMGGTVILAIIQFFCDKNGEKGKRVFKYISTATIVLLVIWLICLVFV